MRYVGTEAAHQIGRAERQGSTLKDVFDRIVISRNLVGGQAMRMAVAESTSVKNTRINDGGFEPSEWVLEQTFLLRPFRSVLRPQWMRLELKTMCFQENPLPRRMMS